MAYTLKREDIYGFASSIGAVTSQRGDELYFRTCPYCDGGAHHDVDTFSINLESGAFCCLRASCGQKGHFVELCRDFDYELEYEVPRIYRQLPQPKKAIKASDNAIKYLGSRGISADVCRRYEVTERKDNPSIIVFPFYDERGVLRFIKYRNTLYKKGVSKGGKEWAEKDTMPILWGMKQVPDTAKTLLICEGEIDQMSLAEAGYDNAVSVPTGASGFTWLVPCREFIERFDEIIVFGDWEHGKMSLLDTLKARVTTAVIKAVRRVDYLGEKDANDILRKYGTGALRKAIENAEVPKLQNVKDLSTVTSVDVNQLDRIKTGIDAVDRTIYGMCMGQVILVYGKRGEGKSNLMSQIICNALDQNESVFAYSGELSDYHFKRWIDYQLAGSENVEEGVNEYGDPVYTVPEEIVEQINLWYKGRAFLFDNEYLAEDDDEFEGLIKTIERVIRQYGTRLICIDNLMTAMEVVTEKDSLFLAQSNFVGQLKKIAMKYQVVILLVAHARKTGEKLTNDDVSGSADITNKVDVVISYARTENENESAIQILKNRLFGKLRYGDDSIKVKYSPKTKRIFDVNEYVPKRYGWERLAKRIAEAEKPNTDEWEHIDLANPPWKKDATGDLWNELF